MHRTPRPSRAPLALTALALVLSSCRGDSVTDPAGEAEVISRVTLTLTPASGTANAPSAQVGTLSVAAGATYTGAIRFENRLVSPIENITDEVRAEGNEHRVFYTVSGTGLTINTTDLDVGGRPLGLAFTAVAPTGTASGARTVRVVLCHYDNVAKPATATSCSAETDIDVTFTVNVP
jgi:hypothetical protein